MLYEENLDYLITGWRNVWNIVLDHGLALCFQLGWKLGYQMMVGAKVFIYNSVPLISYCSRGRGIPVMLTSSQVNFGAELWGLFRTRRCFSE